MKKEHIENNYLIICKDFDEEGEEKESRIAFTMECYNEEDVRKLATQLLRYIARHFCYIRYDKFSKNNLNITWDKKGYKVD